MTPDDVLTGLEAPLSLRRRVSSVAAGLAGLTGSSLIALLWATEPVLPARTHVAFGVLVAIGLAWAGFAGWAVTRRTPLFARDRVVAAWLGVAAWLLFTAGGLAIALGRHRLSPWLIVVIAVLGVAAAGNLHAARRARARLLRRALLLGR
ncbi:hypothetical protein Ade02nite_28180 [Paractinoplanes deccanensis]|uniref:Transmembrane transport protein n=1 Tax=Paractinoplanes deccanensis TaxID=113561 RepID=A0ABQ3Y2H3_9ACTN|nr:hypothetical protein [Actinoplanes deccanensis]GID74177.1 hypothetical protein Ade02nite_28180 [Actinoplanes deccanensis]